MADPRQHHYYEGVEVYRQQEGLELNPYSMTGQTSSNTGDAEPHPKSQNLERTNRNPWSLGPVAFGLLVASVTAIIVGAAVGGGVAGGMTSRKDPSPLPVSSATASSPVTTTLTTTATASTPSASPSAAFTNYSAPAPSAIISLSLDCPALDNKSYTNTRYGDIYTQFCGVDFQQNVLPARGGGVIADIGAIIAYSASDCMDACSNYNQLVNRWNLGVPCAAISFVRCLQYRVNLYGANCWLKNATLASGTHASPNSAILSAVLG